MLPSSASGAHSSSGAGNSATSAPIRRRVASARLAASPSAPPTPRTSVPANTLSHSIAATASCPSEATPSVSSSRCCSPSASQVAAMAFRAALDRLAVGPALRHGFPASSSRSSAGLAAVASSNVRLPGPPIRLKLRSSAVSARFGAPLSSLSPASPPLFPASLVVLSGATASKTARALASERRFDARPRKVRVELWRKLRRRGTAPSSPSPHEKSERLMRQGFVERDASMASASCVATAQHLSDAVVSFGSFRSGERATPSSSAPMEIDVTDSGKAWESRLMPSDERAHCQKRSANSDALLASAASSADSAPASQILPPRMSTTPDSAACSAESTAGCTDMVRAWHAASKSPAALPLFGS
mmetsp:Transcript_6766/g.19658  ORF Transcript_6766/g.19658 Transcript_6766/m.19658 type:complete len:361 (-) Transcript_6766:88-1170(-)